MSPNKTIGILGGGQLAKMLATAAADLGFNVNIYCPDTDCPAAQVANKVVFGNYDDNENLVAFVKNVDVLTYEFENIDTKALEELDLFVNMRPSVKALKISQDRLTEKSYLNSLGIKTTQFYRIDGVSEIEKLFIKLKRPILIKTRRLGYDGKGQVLIKSQDDINEHFLGKELFPSIAEEVISFDRELSVIIVRDKEGNIKTFEPGENVHENGILRHSKIPANITKKIFKEAQDIAIKFAEKLDYVGTLNLEFMIDNKDNLFFNEKSNRVHNGNWHTVNSYKICQFTNHIRAVCGLEFIENKKISNAEMLNILGEEIKEFRKKEYGENEYFFDYLKPDIRPNRKMGHLTILKD